ncbi:MAG: IclR family transcriptional regulator [Micrococcales bacterium]|nr:IclR family transcriptional regulator [Micrococcales bacterium]
MADSASPAVTQALDVLRLLSTRPEPVTATSIARDLGLPRSTTYKLLGILIDEGFVQHLPEDRRYGLGVAAFEVGSAYSRQAGLARLSRPALARLVDEIGYTAHLAVLHGADVFYVLEERAPGRPVLVTHVGVRLPAHLTASGLAMLAELPSAQVRALYPGPHAFVHRHTPGVGCLSELRAELTRVRSRGYARESETVTPECASVAASVVDHRGYPVAALALTYPMTGCPLADCSRTSTDAAPADGPDVGALATGVRAAAAEVTRRIRGVRRDPVTRS